MAYASIEPFGEDRADIRMAILASVVANSGNSKPIGKKQFGPEDFLPKWGPKPQQSQEEMKRMLRRII